MKLKKHSKNKGPSEDSNGSALKTLVESAIKSLKSGSSESINHIFSQLRNKILFDGIPSQYDFKPPVKCKLDFNDLPADQWRKPELTLRGIIWKLFLGVNQVSVSEYFKLLARGVNPSNGRTIRGDITRYRYPKDTPLRRFVRIYNAFCNGLDRDGICDYTYYQEMNAFMIYVVNLMPELEAFYCLRKLVLNCFPAYFNKSGAASQKGAKLVKKCIEKIDTTLFDHLASIDFDLSVICMSSLKTMTLTLGYETASALRLLDLIIVIGPPIIIFTKAAHILDQRDKLLSCESSASCFQLLMKPEEKIKLNERSALEVWEKISKEKELYNEILVVHCVLENKSF